MNTRRHVHVPLVLLALLAGAPRPSGAGEAAPPLEARNLELLPLNTLERQELAQDELEVAQRLGVLVKRADRLRGLLAARKDPADGGSRQLAAQLAAVESDLAPLLVTVVDRVRAHGLDDTLLRHLRHAPDGPLRAARYAMGLPLYVDGVPEAPRSLIAYVLPRVEGALLALHAERKRLAADGGKAIGGADAVRALDATLDARLGRIEKRFWRLVDYAIPEEPRAAAMRLLPTAYQQRESVVQHLYALPDLTAPQGVRLKALLTEIEAESSPEAAAIRRLEGALRDPALAGRARSAAETSLREARARGMALQRYAVDAAREILTAAQWQALEAIPPRVSLADRRETSVQVLASVRLDAEQRTRLDAMRATLSDVRRAYQERRIAVAAKGAAYGPDSPQMMGMQMEMANVEAQGNVLQRAFNGRLFTELLTPEQVVRWVLETPAGE